MLNFRDNFFFAKFAILFFILTIFGYWGIDLNSEELYIAFSFFLLVIVGVVLSRRALALIFIKSVNTKHYRILSHALVIANTVVARNKMLHELKVRARKLYTLFRLYVKFVANFLTSAAYRRLSYVLSTQRRFGNALAPVALSLYKDTIVDLRLRSSFTQIADKFFSIKL